MGNYIKETLDVVNNETLEKAISNYVLKKVKPETIENVNKELNSIPTKTKNNIIKNLVIELLTTLCKEGEINDYYFNLLYHKTLYELLPKEVKDETLDYDGTAIYVKKSMKNKLIKNLDNDILKIITNKLEFL